MEKTEIIKNAFDVLAGFEVMSTAEKLTAFDTVINTLGSYPKPQQKGGEIRAETSIIGAYLCVSNVRNTCKLSVFGYEAPETAHNTVLQNLETALTLLLK